jgi:hypothetical protein
MKKITNVDRKLHPAIGRIRTLWGPGPAPLTKEEVLTMTNVELAEFLSKFKTKDSWEGPSIGGPSDILKEAVKANPNKFADNLEPLEDTDSLFKKIIDGRNPDQIREIIGFFWMQRDFVKESSKENEMMREKIIEFWR